MIESPETTVHRHVRGENLSLSCRNVSDWVLSNPDPIIAQLKVGWCTVFYRLPLSHPPSRHSRMCGNIKQDQTTSPVDSLARPAVRGCVRFDEHLPSPSFFLTHPGQLSSHSCRTGCTLLMRSSLSKNLVNFVSRCLAQKKKAKINHNLFQPTNMPGPQRLLSRPSQLQTWRRLTRFYRPVLISCLSNNLPWPYSTLLIVQLLGIPITSASWNPSESIAGAVT